MNTLALTVPCRCQYKWCLLPRPKKGRSRKKEKTKMKTDDEIWLSYDNGDYESLSNKELERLQKLIMLRDLKLKRPEQNIKTPEIAREDHKPNGSVYFGMPPEWKEKLYHEVSIEGDEIKFSEFGEYFDFTSTDSGCDESVQLGNNWYHSGKFASDIIHAAECSGQLSRMCRKGAYNLDAGNGDKVIIRQISARADPTAVSACTCLSCASNTFDKYEITLSQLGDYAVLCSWDEFKAGKPYRSAVIESMVRHWQVYFDAQIYAALAASSPGTTETLNNTLDCNGTLTGSCCTHGADLYQRILDADAALRQNGYSPDVVIMSPSVANYLKYPQNAQSELALPSIQMEGGVITKIGHLKVIEYCGAQACSTATATTFAWVLDSSRSIAQAFGKQPSLEMERDAECNSWKLVMWCYWGTSVLDVNAIAKIVSPNS